MQYERFQRTIDLIAEVNPTNRTMSITTLVEPHADPENDSDQYCVYHAIMDHEFPSKVPTILDERRRFYITYVKSTNIITISTEYQQLNHIRVIFAFNAAQQPEADALLIFAHSYEVTW